MLNLLESFEDLNSTWIEQNSGCYFDFQKVWQAFKLKAVFKKLSHHGIGEQCLVLAPYHQVHGLEVRNKKNRAKGAFF